MKQIKRLVPKIKKDKNDNTGNDKTNENQEFSNLSSAIGGSGDVSGKSNDVKAKAKNNYTKWPIKVMGLAEKKSKELVNNNTQKEISCTDGLGPISVAQSSLTPKVKHKPVPTVTMYEQELFNYMLTQFEQDFETFKTPFCQRPEWKEKGNKKLIKIRQKLNLKKCDTDYYDWKVGVQIFFTKPEFRIKILRILTVNFQNVVAYFPEKILVQSNVEEFWKSVEHCSEEVWNEIVRKSIARLMSLSATETEEDVLLTTSLKFLGEIWNYFDTKPSAPLMDDESDSIAKMHMEILLTKLETELVNYAKQSFSYNVPEITLQNLCAAIPRFCKELKDNKAYWKGVFQDFKIKLDLYEIVYSVWDLEISDAVKPILEHAKSNIMKVKFQEKYPVLTQNFDPDRDIALFMLFQTLRKFAGLTEKTALPNFVHVKAFLYSWFRDFVPQWIDVACYKAMTRIDIAVKKDHLEPITKDCKRSHSSTFTVNTFSAMEISWHELEWPHPEEAYSFAILTLKNFDRCIQFYAESICNRLEELENANFYCIGGSDELFVAINNVEYVSKKVGTIAENLGVVHLIERLTAYVEANYVQTPNLPRRGSHTSIEQCKETPPNIVQNWKENVHRRVSSCLILTYDKQVAPLLTMFMETAAFPSETQKDSDKIIIHLMGILERMSAKLETTEYARTFPTIADRVLDSFIDFAERNIAGTQSFQFFQQLEDMLVKICALFRKVGIGETVAKRENEIFEISEKIRLYKISIEKLIAEYLNKRYEDQNLSDRYSQQGFLTVIAKWRPDDEVLRLLILNASLHKAENVNSYVRFKIYPKVPSTVKGLPQNYCSKVQKCTKYPLYQESFEISVRKSDMESGGFIHFWIKTGHICNWKFFGEAFLPFDKISKISKEVDDRQQNKLALTLPTKQNAPILDILEDRKDKTGNKFCTTQRQRISLNL